MRLKNKSNFISNLVFLLLLVSCSDNFKGNKSSKEDFTFKEKDTVYWDNGNVKQILKFDIFNKLNGEQSAFNENGILVFKKTYKGSKPLGSFYRFNEFGKIVEYSVTDRKEKVFYDMLYDTLGECFSSEGTLISPSIFLVDDSSYIEKNERLFKFRLSYASPLNYTFKLECIIEKDLKTQNQFILDDKVFRYDTIYNEIIFNYKTKNIDNKRLVFKSKLYDSKSKEFDSFNIYINLSEYIKG